MTRTVLPKLAFAQRGRTGDEIEPICLGLFDRRQIARQCHRGEFSVVRLMREVQLIDRLVAVPQKRLPGFLLWFINRRHKPQSGLRELNPLISRGRIGGLNQRILK